MLQFGRKVLALVIKKPIPYLRAPLVLRVVSLLAKGLLVGLQEAHPALLPVHQVHLVGLLLEQKRQLCLLVYPAVKWQV